MSTIFRGSGGGGKYLGDANVGDVLAGKLYHKDSKVPLVGTMPNRGAVNQSLALNASYTIPAGYHNGLGKVTQALSPNVVDTSAGTATAAHILSGMVAFVDGVQLTGTMPNKTTVHQKSTAIDPNSIAGRLYMKVPKGYFDDGTYSWVYWEDANFDASNIKKGVSMFSKVGTYEENPMRAGSGWLIASPGNANPSSPFNTWNTVDTKTMKQTGTIRVTCWIRANAGGTLYGRVMKNGVIINTEFSSTGYTQGQVTYDVSVNANDVITMQVKSPDGNSEYMRMNFGITTPIYIA